MTRFFYAMTMLHTFFHEHGKSFTLAVGALAIWIAQSAMDVMGAAQDIGNWSVTAVLSLVCIVLSWWVYKRENEISADQKRREEKNDKVLERLLGVIDRNSDAMEKQGEYFAGLGSKLMERGMHHPQFPKPDDHSSH